MVDHVYYVNNGRKIISSILVFGGGNIQQQKNEIPNENILV